MKEVGRKEGEEYGEKTKFEKEEGGRRGRGRLREGRGRV